MRQSRETSQRLQAVLIDQVVQIAFLGIIPADKLQGLALAISDRLVGEFGVGDQPALGELARLAAVSEVLVS